MPLPNFLCVGTMKGGTTTLHDLLKQHPDIYLPTARKELRFFDVDENFDQGLAWYEPFFAGHAGQAAIGEIAPTYAYHEDVPRRIRDVLGPDVKLIFSFRHPIDRAYSHYIMNCMKQYEAEEFLRAIDLEPRRLDGPHPQRLRFGYLDQSRYAGQVRRFLEYFPIENMLFLTLERDLRAGAGETVGKVCRFLGVDDAEIDLDVWSYAGRPVELPVHPILRRIQGWTPVDRMRRTALAQLAKRLLKKPVPKKLDPATRGQLMERYFRKELEELERVVGEDLGRQWREPA